MKRITLFAGHYGSGKTNIAINYSRYLKAFRDRVVIADLDIVNPYFRTKDSADELAAEGIGLVVSEYANSNVDFPALPRETYGVLADRSTGVVIDVGGDDRGALALGRYVPGIVAEGDYEMLAVVNSSRPLTGTVDDTVGVLREIESSAGMGFTGIVNNTNLGPDTTCDTVIASVPYAEGVAKTMGLPVRFTCVPERLANGLAGKIRDVFPLRIQKLYYMMRMVLAVALVFATSRLQAVTLHRSFRTREASFGGGAGVVYPVERKVAEAIDRARQAEAERPNKLRGRVTAVESGNLIAVTPNGGQRTVVRLEGVEAELPDTDGGRAAVSRLKDLVYRKDVEVLWKCRDATGAVIGVVMLKNGKKGRINVNLSVKGDTEPGFGQ